VKGITPAQPAPIHELKKTAVASPSLFNKLFGWLIGPSETSQPVAPAKAQPANPRRERERDGNRSEGGQNRQRNKPRRDRNDRGERDENAPRQDIANKIQPQEARAERQPQQPRPPRQEKENKPALETPKQVTPNDQGEEGNANREGRKRGRRGGRRERERREQTPDQANGNEAVSSEAAAEIIAMSATIIAAPVHAEPAPAPVQVEEHTEQPTPVSVETFVAEPIVVETFEPEVVPESVVVPAPAQASILPALNEAGLVMIETDPNKVATSIPVPQETAPPVQRRRSRPRDIYTIENNEPLEMIETQQQK
jgi:ribonuclease E